MIKGIPLQLKKIRRMNLESAIETWTKLITNVWELVEHQLNEDAT
tara:strand:- start:302 stop:436 length:135 start_codon:yes stop_codon:yes gene_type:complete